MLIVNFWSFLISTSASVGLIGFRGFPARGADPPVSMYLEFGNHNVHWWWQRMTKKIQKLTEHCFQTSKTLWAEVKTHLCRFFFFSFFCDPFSLNYLGLQRLGLATADNETSTLWPKSTEVTTNFWVSIEIHNSSDWFPAANWGDNTKLTTIQNKKSVISKGSRCWGCFRRQRCAQRRIRWCRRCHAYSSRRRSWLKAIERSVAGKASRVLGMAASFFLLSNFTLQHTWQYILPCKGTDWSWI